MTGPSRLVATWPSNGRDGHRRGRLLGKTLRSPTQSFRKVTRPTVAFGSEEEPMQFTRRDLMKMSVLAGAAVALPLERSVSGAPILANRIAESALPKPFTSSFYYPRAIAPERSDATTDYFRVSMEPTSVEIIPG